MYHAELLRARDDFNNSRASQKREAETTALTDPYLTTILGSVISMAASECVLAVCLFVK